MNIPGKKQIITLILCALLFVLALSPVRSAASALTLAWDPNTEDDLAGYKIYYGTLSGDYDSVIDVGDITQYTVTDLEPETQYYFTLTAYDTSSNESDFSAEVSAVTDPPHCVISGLGETSEGWVEAFAIDYSHGDWFRLGWKSYNSVNGETRIATGDIDGDGKDEIVVGLGPVWEQPYPSGYFEVFDDNFTHLTWGRIQWKTYNNKNGESRPSCGDIDGDGYDEIIIGLGWGGGGYFEIFDFDADSITHKNWGRVKWKNYNTANGETRPACGDIDGDARDEIVIGLGPVDGQPYPGGYFEVLDDDYTHLAWGRIPWSSYNSVNGESRPACGDVDGDGVDEIIVGLGSGSNGYFAAFNYDAGYVTHTGWGRVHWSGYNSANGETRPACGDIDGDARDEIVIGLGPVDGQPYPGGYFEVLDDAVAGYAHLAWPRIHWGTYNSTNGETWPALKK